jgi:phosphatidylglycerophosphate synthase
VGFSPAQVSWASFGVSVIAAGCFAAGLLHAGLWLMALGQAIDALDGAMAREFGLASAAGERLDTALDRASEGIIFLGLVIAGFAPPKLVLLAFTAIMLLTTLVERTRLDPGFKRFVLYFGPWVPYPVLFTVMFAVNLAAYVVGLLFLDIQFQHRMDRLGGDLDTIASRAARLEATERTALRAAHSA